MYIVLRVCVLLFLFHPVSLILFTLSIQFILIDVWQSCGFKGHPAPGPAAPTITQGRL